MSLQNMENSAAPWITVHDNDIMSIEHPCIVKNRAKAIEMLGGAQGLSQILDQGTQQSLALSFHPNDPASRTIMSLHNDTSNVLLKVTVPKRTGRKRKRGSNDEYIEDTAPRINTQDASHLVDSLQRSRHKRSIEAVGNIKSCHIWRSIPDFAFFTKSSSFLKGIESHILPQQYPAIKGWTLPRTYGMQSTEIVPPPVFSTQTLSHNYTYRQNPAVQTLADPTTGSKTLVNRSAPIRLHIQIMMYDDTNYPTGPSPNCPPLKDQIKQTKKLVQQLQDLFDQRPIWTRRALVNSLPLDIPFHLVRIAAAYVCYSLRSGPWRDAYVKFGIDPRTDPKYRKYQTILLKLVAKDKASMAARGQPLRLWTRSPDTRSHIFTGTKAVPIDGKTWQLCDLQDPDLVSLVEIPDLFIRAQCEKRYFGWYANGTSAKMRVLLKAKIDALADGDQQLDREKVELFLRLPESWTPNINPNEARGNDPVTGYLPEKSSSKELEWASAYRSICRTVVGGLPLYGGSGKGRLPKKKPTARPSYLGPAYDNDEDEEGDANMGEAEQQEDGEEAASDAEAAEGYEEPEDGDDDLIAENADENDNENRGEDEDVPEADA